MKVNPVAILDLLHQVSLGEHTKVRMRRGLSVVGAALAAIAAATLILFAVPADAGRRGKPIPVYARETLVELIVVQGYTVRQAAAAFNNRMSQRSIERFLERWREFGHVDPHPRLGKPFG